MYIVYRIFPTSQYDAIILGIRMMFTLRLTWFLFYCLQPKVMVYNYIIIIHVTIVIIPLLTLIFYLYLSFNKKIIYSMNVIDKETRFLS